MIDRSEITGLVLAGGRATRMSGVDKGLQAFHGVPLALHAVLRLAPQVGEVIVSANRNLAAYESMGVPVWPDPVGDYQGPLAGWLAGFEHCSTAYMASVPCDAPDFPADLVARLARSLAESEAEIAIAAVMKGGMLQMQTLFSLFRYMQAGERSIEEWTRRHRCVEVRFEDGRAFANASTAAELQQLQATRP